MSLDTRPGAGRDHDDRRREWQRQDDAVATPFSASPRSRRARCCYRGKDIAKLDRGDWLEYRREVQAIFQDPFGVYNPFYRIRHIFDVAIKRFGLATSKARGARR